MDNYSSEIEIAIKIGEVKLTGLITSSWGTQNADTFKQAIIALGVDYEKDALTDNSLNSGLRALTIHRGDISYERFLKSINWQSYHEVKIAAAFILGLGYIYPVTSIIYNIKYLFNTHLPDGYKNSTSISSLYNNARNLYLMSIRMKDLIHQKRASIEEQKHSLGGDSGTQSDD